MHIVCSLPRSFVAQLAAQISFIYDILALFRILYASFRLLSLSYSFLCLLSDCLARNFSDFHKRFQFLHVFSHFLFHLRLSCVDVFRKGFAIWLSVFRVAFHASLAY